jgi:hypothetical protein
MNRKAYLEHLRIKLAGELIRQDSLRQLEQDKWDKERNQLISIIQFAVNNDLLGEKKRQFKEWSKSILSGKDNNNASLSSSSARL